MIRDAQEIERTGQLCGNTARRDDFLATREAAELNRAFTAISDPAVRRKIIELIKTLGDDGTPKKPSL